MSSTIFLFLLVVIYLIPPQDFNFLLCWFYLMVFAVAPFCFAYSSRWQGLQTGLQADLGEGSSQPVWSCNCFLNQSDRAPGASLRDFCSSLSLFHSPLEQKSSHTLLSSFPPEGYFTKEFSFFTSSVTFFCFILASPLLKATQTGLCCECELHQHCKHHNRWQRGLMSDYVPFSTKHSSAKRAVLTVQQIQVLTTVVGRRSKRLFRDVLHVCLW